MNTITARALNELDIPPPRQVVNGLITAGLNILAGNPKSGKSFLALGLALDLTNGHKALGAYGAEKTGVLYLALEDTRYRLRTRVRALGLPPTDLLHFSTELPRLGDGGLDLIDDFIYEHPETGMVVIDTLAKVADARAGANVYEEDAALGGALHALAHHHDVAFLVIHHTRKQAHGDFLHMVSGSAGFTGTADTVLVLTRKRGENTATLEVTGRDILEAQVELRWVKSGGGWRAMQKETQYPTPRYHS
jgi:RecA-family ATPase